MAADNDFSQITQLMDVKRLYEEQEEKWKLRLSEKEEELARYGAELRDQRRTIDGRNELVQVEAMSPEIQPVASALGHDDVRGEDPAQRRDVHLQRCARRGRHAVGPQAVDQRVRGDPAPGIEREDGEKPPVRRSRDLDLLSTADTQGPEHLDPQRPS